MTVRSSRRWARTSRWLVRLEGGVRAASHVAHSKTRIGFPHDRDGPPLREREVTPHSGAVERLRGQCDPAEHDASERIDHGLWCPFHGLTVAT